MLTISNSHRKPRLLNDSQKPEECFIKVFQAIRAQTIQHRNVYIYTSTWDICHTRTYEEQEKFFCKVHIIANGSLKQRLLTPIYTTITYDTKKTPTNRCIFYLVEFYYLKNKWQKQYMRWISVGLLTKNWDCETILKRCLLPRKTLSSCMVICNCVYIESLM